MKIEDVADMKMVERREMAKKNPIHCACCGSDQVQLVDYRTDEMEWKCRHCGAMMATSFKRWAMEVGEDKPE